MESPEIIDSIHKIYEEHKVPKNLQEHMFRSAACAEFICDHWKGPKINKNDILAVLLIHDIGNIVKMDFNDEQNLMIMEEEAKNIEFWKERQRLVISKYGNDDHIVTSKIADELCINNRLKFLLENKIFIKNEFILNTGDWDIKICAYSDQRIGPFGIMLLKDRFNEAKARYANKKNTSMTHPKVDIFIECAYKIENQILENTSLTPESISDNAIKRYIEKYKKNQN